MATIEEAVYARMVGYAELAALAGQRIYPLVIPQDVGEPAVAYQKIDSIKQASHAGTSNLARSRFQFTCQADGYLASKTLAAAVRHCWEGYRGTVSTVRIDGSLIESERDDYDDQTLEPVSQIDVVIWHAEN